MNMQSILSMQTALKNATVQGSARGRMEESAGIYDEQGLLQPLVVMDGESAPSEDRPAAGTVDVRM